MVRGDNSGLPTSPRVKSTAQTSTWFFPPNPTLLYKFWSYRANLGIGEVWGWIGGHCWLLTYTSTSPDTEQGQAHHLFPQTSPLFVLYLTSPPPAPLPVMTAPRKHAPELAGPPAFLPQLWPAPREGGCPRRGALPHRPRHLSHSPSLLGCPRSGLGCVSVTFHP